MTRFTRIAVCLAGAVLWGVGPGRAAPVIIEFYHENVMGTSLELRVRADDEAAARRAEDCVLREIDRLSAIFSGYDPASEFSRWQAGPGAPATVSPELFEVLRASRRLAGRGAAGPSTPGSRPSRGSGRPAPGRTGCRRGRVGSCAGP